MVVGLPQKSIRKLQGKITNNVRAVNTIFQIDTPLFIGIIAEILGHSNLESVKEYVKISTVKVQQTISQIGFCA